jgi:hypothetical protein
MDNEESVKTSIERFAEQFRKPEAVLFWQYLDENPSEKPMLAGLYQAGCDPLTLMTLGVLYCKGEELGVTENAKRATGYSAPQLASFSERLLQAAKDIQALNEAAMPGGVTLWKLIRVLGGGELLEQTLAPVLPSEQLDFEFTRLPVILAAYSVFLKSLAPSDVPGVDVGARTWQEVFPRRVRRLHRDHSRTHKLERNRRCHSGSPFRVGQAGGRHHGYGKPQVRSRGISHAESRRLRRHKEVGGNGGGFARSQYGRKRSPG